MKLLLPLLSLIAFFAGCGDESVSAGDLGPDVADTASDTIPAADIESELDEPSDPDSVAEVDTPDSGFDSDTIPATDTVPDTDTHSDTDTLSEPDVDPSEGLTLVVREGTQVLPQTLLHFTLEWPGRLEGVSVNWSVVTPFGPSTVFTLANGGLEASYTANMIGTYLFTAVVSFQSGESYTRTKTVVVLPGDGLYIELTWRTPGAPDTVGTDVDLHLLRVQPGVHIFDEKNDCSRTLRQTDWGGPGSPNNCVLDPEVTDGAGPEVITIAEFEPDMGYLLGVQYWDDFGYGHSYVNLRIAIGGVIVEEWKDIELTKDNLWMSHMISGNGDISRIGEEPTIYADCPLAGPATNPCSPDWIPPWTP